MIRLEGVTKRWPNGLVAVDELTLQVDDGELCVLVGPSGCGKTTTLKVINRLLEPTSGRILLGDTDVTHADPVELRRQMGYVIQQVGLFPHQTVGANVATVPRLLGWDRKRVRARVDELLELMGLDPPAFRDRYPHQLSGGQRQRVGVARALGADPPVLLMDEPFGALDPITRERLQNEFLRLQDDLGKTIVFVTHDIEEAVKLGDRIAILEEGGVLAQHDTPAAILASPANEFVAGFVGADRGIKRLDVTRIEPAALVEPPLVAEGASLSDARLAVEGSPEGWALVVGRGRELRGWLARGDDRLRAVDAVVPVTGTLKDAFAVMLLHDLAWVAVVDDGNRLLGIVTPSSLHAATRRPPVAEAPAPVAPPAPDAEPEPEPEPVEP